MRKVVLFFAVANIVLVSAQSAPDAQKNAALSQSELIQNPKSATYWGNKSRDTSLLLARKGYNLDLKTSEKYANGRLLYRHERGLFTVSGRELRCVPNLVFTTTGPIIAVTGPFPVTAITGFKMPNRVNLPEEIGKVRVAYVHWDPERPAISVNGIELRYVRWAADATPMDAWRQSYRSAKRLRQTMMRAQSGCIVVIKLPLRTTNCSCRILGHGVGIS